MIPYKGGETKRELVMLNDRIEETTMVYIVEAKGTGLYKIGYTSSDDVLARIATMQTGCPYELVPTIIIPNGSEKTERALHYIYQDQNIRGEWFNLSSRNIDGLREHFNGNVIYQTKLHSDVADTESSNVKYVSHEALSDGVRIHVQCQDTMIKYVIDLVNLNMGNESKHFGLEYIARYVFQSEKDVAQVVPELAPT